MNTYSASQNVAHRARHETVTAHKHAVRHIPNEISSAVSKSQVLHDPAEFSPLWAATWADTIICFWRILIAEGRLDPANTIDVVDLMPGTGQSVLQMLQALRSRLGSLPGFKGTFRYLIVAPKRKTLNGFREFIELQHYFSEGVLVTAIWDPKRGDPCLLHPGKREPWRPINPVCVLAHNCWSHDDQQLLAVHYGRLLEADIGRLSKCTSQEQEAKEWQPAKLHNSGATLESLIKSYLTKFNSVPVTVPVGGIKQLDRISALAARGYLILAAGCGFTSEQQARLSRFTDMVSTYRANSALPLNFYLISQYCAQIAATSWQLNIRSNFAAQIIIGNLPDLSVYAPAIAEQMGKTLACDTPSFVEAAKIVSSSSKKEKLDTLLALLRHSEYDAAVFEASASAIIQGMRSNPELDRKPWAEVLNNVWSRHFPCAHTVPLHRSIAPAAMRIGAWSLARKAITRGMQVHGESALDLAHLAWCEMRTGNARNAIAFAERAASLDRKGSTVREVWETINSKLASWKGGWASCLPSATLPIVLEPLDPGHTEALFYQYRDPQIAVMTGLPPLADVAAARDWIKEHLGDTSRRPYVIIHRDHGLVGFVCLSITGDEGYLCFWIGTDFQGTGLSVEAARLVIQHARNQQIRYLFTSAYQDNTRSLAALRRIGFSLLGIRALPPESDRIFLFMNLSDTPVDDPEKRLVFYYEREKLPLYFPGQEKRREDEQAAAEKIKNDSRTV